ncbi:stalk domain-containing protein [Paenibacillus sp. GSMTC-2017]|uniref:stalk domain-containing protein n=1 Tax=Paenibacillus sp. GSMTC-2017 TaxID=2794350 RepID=UPI002FBE853E
MIRDNKGIISIVSFIMLVVSSLLVAQSAEGAQSKRIEVYTDKQLVKFTNDPILKNGTTLVQLRPLFESLGIEVLWDDKTKTVSGKKEGQTFSLTLNSKTAKVNGKSVTLASPGVKVNGHTMVPLRFVGEATGAVVGWNKAQQTISIYSEAFIKLTGISKATAQKEVNKGAPIVIKGKPNGFYAKWEVDLIGLTYCGTLCWDYYYFVNDKQVATEFPDGGIDALDCSKHKCLTYEIKGNTIVLSNGKTYSYKLNADSVEINGEKYTKFLPSATKRLEGKYESTSYMSSQQGATLTTSTTYTFKKDGTFHDSSFKGVTADVTDQGDDSGVSVIGSSDSKKSGTYTIVNYSLLLKYSEGTSKQQLFFLPEQPDVNMLRIGGRDYLLEEADGTNGKPSKPGTEPKEEKPYEDLLTTEKIAKKEILFSHQPNDKKELAGIEFTLEGYQWAKLTIESAYQKLFTGYGDKGIIALTVKYSVTNKSTETINVNSLNVSLELNDPEVGILASNQLAPIVKDELKPGESVEKMSVILLSADYFERNKDFELGLGPLHNLDDKDVFEGKWLGFYIWKDL